MMAKQCCKNDQPQQTSAKHMQMIDMMDSVLSHSCAYVWPFCQSSLSPQLERLAEILLYLSNTYLLSTAPSKLLDERL
eukprot:4010830-Karenia_brevis.AAC.1